MQSDVVIETTRGKLISEDKSTEFEICHAYSIEETTGEPLLITHVYKNGVLVGDPIRYKMAGNRLAADFPGLDSASFIIDGNGKITNG